MMMVFLNLGVLMAGLLCMLTITGSSVAFENSKVRCVESERQALLKFKQGLEDNANLLSSWTSENEDCCRWTGVGCNNQTGHIIMLDLRPRITYHGDGYDCVLMGGELGSSLLELRYLNHLDLSFNAFTEIPEFIGSLSKLTYLNFSLNDLSGTTIPVQLGNLSRLRTLDLSRNYGITTNNLEWLSRLSSLRILNMVGADLTKAVNWLHSIKSHPSLSTLNLDECEFPEVDPSSLSHINSSNSLASLVLSGSSLHPSTLPLLFTISSKLVYLDLSSNQLKGIPDSFENMPSLEYLDISHNQLEGGIPRSLGNLCNLKTLIMSHNNFSGLLPDLLQNLTGCAKNSIEHLDFSFSQLEGGIPKSMGSLCNLQTLDMARNNLSGPVSNLFRSLAGCTMTSLDQFSGSLPNISRSSSLRDLYLDYNNLEGPIPDSIGNLSKLAVLSLANNQLTGSLPESIGKITSLSILDVSFNSLNGVISEVHMSNITKLQQLHLSLNSFALNFSSDWVPPFQLDSIKMRSCKLGPLFPSWLRNQKNFSHLDISNSEISDAIPSWFWNLPSKLQYLNLSCNHINGKVSNLPLKFNYFPAVDLSSNLFSGPIPQFLSNTTVLNLSKNMFSGSLSFLCTILDSALSYLVLSDNQLSGGLTHCWMHFNQLVILNLENNNLSGMIPSSLGSLYQIETLHLRNNSISGKLPSTLKNCSELKLLDLGENKLTGKLPEWIGESLSNLIVLRLRSNKFFGNIPSTMCHLSSIQILDLSFNNLSGTIPSCLNNLTAMAGNGSSETTISDDYVSSYNYWNGSDQWSGSLTNSFDFALVVWKGVEQEYGKTLGLLRIIDLSSNNLTGEIPIGVTDLLGLCTLNLSRNNLTGTIPKEIGQLKELESLDLSGNQLSGEIPGSLADISYLEYLNLSNNQLSGKIPVGTQLQSFNASSYLGNSELFGCPLPKKCPGHDTVQDSPNTGGSENKFQEGGEWFDRSSLYAGLGVGFAVGFWGFFGPLLFYRSWRYACLRFLNDITDWICLTIALKVPKLQRMFQS